MKTTYKPGKYKLIQENDIPGFSNKTFYVNLTASQAKVLFQKYNDLGFCEIEYIAPEYTEADFDKDKEAFETQINHN